MWSSRGLGTTLDWPTRGLGETYLIPPPLPGGTVNLKDIAPDIYFLVLVPDVEICFPDDSNLSLASATICLRLAEYCRLATVSPMIAITFEAATVGLEVDDWQLSMEAAPSVTMTVLDQQMIDVSAATVSAMSSEDNP